MIDDDLNIKNLLIVIMMMIICAVLVNVIVGVIKHVKLVNI